ncbi:hypothetical protein [Shewanella nanhaiensis]|uniref:Uncharacterized protein n=1 Tax=Shewanella nanhaiensis TaxID=2864872 RepID=A0ABS7DZP4_9GAMM|nr:hypothetical protein [Shewanella nanhaiensis]MBW8182880.1 hypothetical protein [Shewanella nanhaiensis]
MNKKPWERRLKDLAHLLNSCSSTYFEPELFRLNLNQFLQTARTVTFIIQKNKHDIEGYDDWYPQNVIDKWKDDPLMTWAKNSRNVIEKQGDLEMYSDAKATLLFSYVEEQDVEIVTKDRLLSIGIKKLIRLAQKKLPSGVLDAAVVKSERRWVANTLEDFELLGALTVIYARIYDCCKALGEHIGVAIAKDIPAPTGFDSMREEIRRVSYLKLKNFNSGKLSYDSVAYDADSIPENIKERARSLGTKGDISNTENLVDYYSKMAELTFSNDGYHIPILMLFDREYKVIDLVSTRFDDQADKYIFWRLAADRAKTINAHGFLWVSELWIRNSKINSTKAIREMPIIDEQLQVVGIDSNNNQKIVSWKILRESEHAKPTLGKPESKGTREGQAFFMRPVLKAIGGDISALNG